MYFTAQNEFYVMFLQHHVEVRYFLGLSEPSGPEFILQIHDNHPHHLHTVKMKPVAIKRGVQWNVQCGIGSLSIHISVSFGTKRKPWRIVAWRYILIKMFCSWFFFSFLHHFPFNIFDATKLTNFELNFDLTQEVSVTYSFEENKPFVDTASHCSAVRKEEAFSQAAGVFSCGVFKV